VSTIETLDNYSEIFTEWSQAGSPEEPFTVVTEDGREMTIIPAPILGAPGAPFRMQSFHLVERTGQDTT